MAGNAAETLKVFCIGQLVNSNCIIVASVTSLNNSKKIYMYQSMLFLGLEVTEQQPELPFLFIC